MKQHRTKTCTHCGEETHPQPQDHDHDTGYGHCYGCLKKDSWYVRSWEELAKDILLYWYECREHTGGPLTSDDSHPKVVEIYVNGKIDYHQTLHSTKGKIREALQRKYLTFDSI